MKRIFKIIKLWIKKLFDKKTNLSYIQVEKEEPMKKATSKEVEVEDLQPAPSLSHVAVGRFEDEDGNLYHIRIQFDPNSGQTVMEKIKCINENELNEMFLIDCGRYDIS